MPHTSSSNALRRGTTVRFAEPPRRYFDSDEESFDSDLSDAYVKGTTKQKRPPNLPPRGTLDDVPLDFECNSEGFRFTTEQKKRLMSRHSVSKKQLQLDEGAPLASDSKSYMRIEVISARQIRNLLTFFKCFIAAALAYAFFILIACSTIYKVNQDLPFPAQLLYDYQKSDLTVVSRAKAVAVSGLRRSAVVDMKQSTTNKKARGQWSRNSPLRHRGLRQTVNDSTTKSCPVSEPKSESERAVSAYVAEAYLMSQGVYILDGGLVRGPNCSLSSTYYSYVSGSSHSDGDGGARNSSRLWATSLRQSNSSAKFYLVNQSINVLPKLLMQASNVISTSLSIFFALLTLLFALRMIQTGWNSISHEQVWALLLLLVTAFYFNGFAKGIDFVDQLSNSKGQVKHIVPGGIRRVADVMDSIRDAVFSAFIFFYLLASFHSYRILDLSKPLSFHSFYLPKLVIVGTYLAATLSAVFLLDFEFSKVPVLAFPALMRAAARFPIWSYHSTLVVAALVRSVLDAIMLAVVLHSGYLTRRILRRSPYMRYRAKRVGFQFFFHVSALFSGLFLMLQMAVILLKPRGDLVVLLLTRANHPVLEVFWTYTAAGGILLTGYVLCMGYIHLPYTSVGTVMGWVKGTELAIPGSRWKFTKSGKLDREQSGPLRTAGSMVMGKSFDFMGDTPGLGGMGIQGGIGKASTSGGGGSAMYDSGVWATPGTFGSDEDDKNTVGSTSGDEGGGNTRRRSASAMDETAAKIRAAVEDDDAALLQPIVEPVTYRKCESKDVLEMKANCFTMQTHVILFNFSWFAYYYGTSKMNFLGPDDTPMPFKFMVDGHVVSRTTDTHVLVLDCSDRIVVAFRGTIAMKYLRTPLSEAYEALQSMVCADLNGENDSERLTNLFGGTYLAAKVHKAMADSYMSVMDEVVDRVQMLREKKLRPVFLTGYSFGGALATICSLDLWVKLHISRREMVLSTFGSPRIGNAQFAQIHERVVPLHWRIVVEPDMIAQLPTGSFTHVGTPVILTADGDMKIDPNVLDQPPRLDDVGGMAYHRKASYLLAMRGWCMRSHGLSYAPSFWPYPVMADDVRRFEVALSAGDGMEAGDLQVSEAKVTRLEAMAEVLLEKDDGELNNMAAVENWGSVTRRLLLDGNLSRVNV